MSFQSNKSGIFHVATILFFSCLALLGIAPANATTLPAGFTETQIAEFLAEPVSMAFAPDGRIFICEQQGRLRVHKNGAVLPTPFTTIDVDYQGERGLIGVAIDPAFNTNHYVYVYYTAKAPVSHNRISRFTANGDVAVAGSEHILLDIDPLGTALIHNGGTMRFGPDGKLYVGVGENGVSSNAQTLNNLKGKLLRINSDGTIPTDNPFYGTATGNNRAIYALGFRNPFNFDIQPGTSRIFVNDVGESNWEEINDVVAGRNFGWPATEGNFDPAAFPNFTNPLFAYAHGDTGVEGCAVTGGAFYNPTSPDFPAQYVGKYFFTDYCNNWIRILDPATRTATSFATGTQTFPVDLKVGPDGALYYLSLGFGAIYRIDYPANLPPTITSHPQSRTVLVGQSTTFSVSANGTPPLRYQWQRNEADIPGATAASYTLALPAAADNNARFRAVVTNDFGSATSNTAVLTVSSNRPPVATITAPTAGTLYSGGQVINFAGTGTDPDEGTLSASRFTWRVDFHHDAHTHPFVPNTSGVTSGSFTIPTVGETSANVWYRIHLTVTDSQGATNHVQRDVLPRKVNLTLAGNPSGLQVNLDGMPHTTPYTFTGVVGIRRNIEAVQPQTASGLTYVFNSWSDGGAEKHDISTPTSDTTYTANFGNAATSPLISVDFTGGGPNGDPAAMSASEVAGALPAANWNNAAGASGSLAALRNRSGANTGAAISWTSSTTWSTTISDTAGNFRMMKGFLNAVDAATTVRVSALPAEFATQGYSVLVYCDGDNAFADRQGIYAIGANTITLTDPAGVNFSGAFTRSAGSNGNYVLFSGLTGSAFTLTATPGTSQDTTPRAAINGIQIIARTAPLVATYRIHGRIATSGGIAIPNVSVTRTGSSTPQITNSAGYYVFSGVPNGTYTVTPSLSGYSFTPSSKVVTINGADALNQNFTGGTSATYRIYGRIATSSGAAIPNVRVTRSGSATAVTTNSAGYYILTGVPNGTYTVTPSLSGFTFTPVSKTLAVNGADAGGHNFTGSNGS